MLTMCAALSRSSSHANAIVVSESRYAAYTSHTVRTADRGSAGLQQLPFVGRDNERQLLHTDGSAVAGPRRNWAYFQKGLVLYALSGTVKWHMARPITIR